MPYVDKNEAQSILERTREILKKNGCIHIGKEKICYTFSTGITDTLESGYNLDDLIKAADKRLYEAKTTGRDKIIYH